VVASASQPEATPPIADIPADHRTDGPSSTQSGSGPQLLHRPSPSAANSVARGGNGAKQQTVAFVDTDSGQVTKTGVRDKMQAIQQSATAVAGIYKRLDAVDHH
jgi:hypothetical protein